jgi:hypothetical protein
MASSPSLTAAPCRSLLVKTSGFWPLQSLGSKTACGAQLVGLLALSPSRRAEIAEEPTTTQTRSVVFGRKGCQEEPVWPCSGQLEVTL